LLRSRAGRVTPLPDLDVVELGRQGLLSACITSPRVSRRQATLLRSPGGALRVVSQGANPTAVVTRAGAILRLAGGAGADVAAGDMIVLCPGRLLRDMGGAADEDEAFTLVEADIDDLPAALREIARLRAALAARPPTAAATPAPEPVEAPIVEAVPTPTPMLAEPATPAPEPAPEPTEESEAPGLAANERPEPADDDAQAAPALALADVEAIAVDAVAVLTSATDLEAASLTHTDDGSRFALRWRGGGASCVQIEDGAWRVVDVSGAATAEARVGRALALAAALADADDVPRSGVDGAMAAFLGGAAPVASDDVESAEDDDDSAGDFEEDAAPGTAMLVDEALASDGEASRYDGGSDDDEDDTAGARYVERLLADAAREKFDVMALRWDGTSLRGVVAGPATPCTIGAALATDEITQRWAVRVDVVATARDVVLRASADPPVYGVSALPVLQLLAAAAAAPGSIVRDAAVTSAAATLEPRDIANVLLHAVATATSASAYDGLATLVTSDDSGDAVMATLAIEADEAAVDALATPAALRLVSGAPVPLTTAEKAGVLHAIAHELDGTATQEAVRRAAERITGQPKYALDATKSAAVAALCPGRPARAAPVATVSSSQFKAVDRAFYDSEAGLVYGRVRGGDGTYTSVAFAAKPVDGDCLDPARCWSGGEVAHPLLPPVAIAFSRLATEAVDVCALRTALLALPDLRAAAMDLAFSVDTAGSGLDESVPRLLAAAAASGAPAPGDAYVRALRPVVLDAAAASDDPSF